MDKIVFVIGQQGFRDEELLDTKAVLEKAYEVHIASTLKGRCVGKLGVQVDADLSISDALTRAAEWRAVIVIGGPGVQSLFTDKAALNLIKRAHHLAAVKVLGAICWAPIVLARAGVLNGVKMTAWDDGAGSQLRELKAAGATIVPQHVAADGKLVTADGPKAAKDFGRKILEVLRA